MAIIHHEICFACGIADIKVEGGGLLHCPNPLCHGCGAQTWRSANLKSYEAVDDASHSCDTDELIKKALECIANMDEPLKSKCEAIKERCIHKFLGSENIKGKMP